MMSHHLVIVLLVVCVSVIFPRASPSLGQGSKGDLISLQLVDVQDNAIVVRNGVLNIVSSARVEVVQKNVTCLILLATEGVDAVLELMQRVARRVKPRVWMPTDVLQQLALLLILTWTHVSTTMIGCIEKLQVAMNKHIFKATSLSLIFLCSMGNIL